MESGEVVGGDYKGQVVGTCFTGKKVWIVAGFGIILAQMAHSSRLLYGERRRPLTAPMPKPRC